MSRCLCAIALILTTACGSGGSPHSGESRWVVERPGAPGARDAAPRVSTGNVSRPLWSPARGEVTLQPEPGACIELELAPLDSGVEAPTVALVFAREAGEERVEALAFGSEGSGPRPWLRYRFDLADLPAGTWKMELLVDGRALGDESRWLASAPRVLQRRQADGRPNVLFITVDTLRADYLGCYGHDRPTSPHIDALAAGGARFERAISQSSWTLPSYATLFSGRDPESHGVVHIDQRFSEEFVSFVEILASAGYSTGAVVSGTFTDSYWGFDQGFDSYDDLGMVLDDEAAVTAGAADPTDLRRMEQGAHKRITSPEVTDKALRWLGEHQGERFLLLAHYFDPHADYLPHPRLNQRFPPRPGPGMQALDTQALQRAAYEAEIAFTDRHIGRLLAGLESLGLADETVVVLQADHGEAFDEHGTSGHGSNLYNEQVWIPLLMRVPGFAARTIPDAVGVLDLGPTLLELCAADPQHPFQGRSLVPLLQGNRTARELPVSASIYNSFAPEPGRRGEQVLYRVDEGRASVIGSLRSGAQGQWMFDWAADPGQLHNLAPRNLESVQQVAQRYLSLREALHAQRPELKALDLGADTLETLSGLGYTGDAEDEDQEDATSVKALEQVGGDD